MDSFDSKLNVLCEIIMKKDPHLSEEIRGLKLSAISNPDPVSQKLMIILRSKLIDWEINIQSFDDITSSENALNTMYYLIETIQGDFLIGLDKVKNIKDMLSKDVQTKEKLYDYLDAIPELLEEFEKYVEHFKINIDRRINIHKSLKEFASDIFFILSIIKKKLVNMHCDEISLNNNVYEYMQKLINLSIVITTYPPRTIKKGTASKAGTHFKTTIGCLIESENLFSKESVHAYFLTEEDFRNFLSSEKFKKDCKIDFKHNFIRANNWELKNMTWSPSERHQCNRKKTEKITNNKAILAFHFEASANPHLFGLIPVKSYLFSDTVISIVHTNQEIDALITLFWDDYFRINSSILIDGTFKCKENISINDFAVAVSKYFEKETSRELTDSNIEFIRRKLFKTVPQGQMTFYQFSNQTMENSTMSFGNWIMSLIKLLKTNGTCDLWKHDYIDGFIKKDAEAIFSEVSPGTFLLRFSEKHAKIGVLLKTPNNKLEAWNPFSVDECRNRNLCDRLMEFHELKFIRAANGKTYNKEDILSQFIECKELDEGYTERGQLAKILCSNIYSEPFREFDDNSMFDDSINNDPLLGSNISEVTIFDFP